MKLFKDKKHKVKFHNPKKLLLFCHSALLPLCLTGCMGVYEGGFECPAGIGVGCKSISDVNTMVNLGEIPKAPAEQPITTKPEIWYAPSMYNAQKACPSTVDAENKKKTQDKAKVKHVTQSV